jgi:hypothetical protein
VAAHRALDVALQALARDRRRRGPERYEERRLLDHGGDGERGAAAHGDIYAALERSPSPLRPIEGDEHPLDAAASLHRCRRRGLPDVLDEHRHHLSVGG